MQYDRKGNGKDRRQALECMAWSGTGLVWTLSGGVPGAKLIGEAQAATTGFSFVQISDSHVGFDKPANPNTLGTLEEAIAKIGALSTRPAFMIHTGDITHLSKPRQFDDAEQRIARAKLDVHYVPGEHDIIDENNGQAYLERYGKLSKGKGWYSFDHGGVHFVGLNNVFDLKAGGMGNLGAEQLAWLAEHLKGKSASTPIVVFAHVPLWTVAAEWGWGTQDAAQALTTVVIDNFTFAPAAATVKAGTRVRFVNHDDIPQTVVLANGKIRSKALDTDDSSAFVFDKPGEFVYFCGLHPQMKGEIKVTP